MFRVDCRPRRPQIPRPEPIPKTAADRRLNRHGRPSTSLPASPPSRRERRGRLPSPWSSNAHPSPTVRPHLADNRPGHPYRRVSCKPLRTQSALKTLSLAAQARQCFPNARRPDPPLSAQRCGSRSASFRTARSPGSRVPSDPKQSVQTCSGVTACQTPPAAGSSWASRSQSHEASPGHSPASVSYTHLTLPTKRIV